MKKIICGVAFAVLATGAPAHAQLTPVYGWLRTALENSMAQALPPYGRENRTTTANPASQDNNVTALDRKQDAVLKDAAAAEQEK